MKGFMIFVEGGTSPIVVHVNEKTALAEARRLSSTAPDREVLLLRITKRYKCTDGVVQSIGSHLPAKLHLTTSDLVRHDSPDISSKNAKKSHPLPPNEPKKTKLTLPKRG